MKKILGISILLFLASCSNQANLALNEINPPITQNASINSNTDSEKIVIYHRDYCNCTLINLEPAIKKLTGNKITVKAVVPIDLINDDTTPAFEISFSKGQGEDILNYDGKLVMQILKNGKSGFKYQLVMTENYHENFPRELTFDQAKKLVKSATNYKSNVDKLSKFFGN